MFPFVLPFRESSLSNRSVYSASLLWFACVCIIISVPFRHHDIYNTLLASGCWLESNFPDRQRNMRSSHYKAGCHLGRILRCEGAEGPIYASNGARIVSVKFN